MVDNLEVEEHGLSFLVWHITERGNVEFFRYSRQFPQTHAEYVVAQLFSELLFCDLICLLQTKVG